MFKEEWTADEDEPENMLPNLFLGTKNRGNDSQVTVLCRKKRCSRDYHSYTGEAGVSLAKERHIEGDGR